MNSTVEIADVDAARNRLATLRLLVVFPGAFVKGLLGVALPWSLTSSVSSATLLGLLTSAVIAFDVLGSLVGGWAASRVGERATAVVCAALSTAALVASATFFVFGVNAAAYVCLLAVYFCDSSADVAAHSRLPVIARLAKTSLTRLASGNWLWALTGAISGGLFGGWCLGAGFRTALAFAVVIAAFTTFLGQAVTLPRDSTRSPSTRAKPTFKSVLAFVAHQRELLIVCGLVVGGSLLLGPTDQLIVPFVLSRGGYSAEFFSWVLAASALGAAVGLVSASHFLPQGRYRGSIILVGTIGIAAYIALWLTAPSAITILAGMALAAALAAPMLPVLEATLLRCAAPQYRAMLIGLLTAMAGAADAVGGLTMGAGLDWLGPTVPLLIVLLLVLAGGVLAAWSFRKQNSKQN